MNGNRDKSSHAERQAIQRELGLGIQRIRRRKGWNRETLAERLGVSPHSLAKWELGVHAPPLHELLALLQALEVTFEELALGRRAPAAVLAAAQRSEAAMFLNGFLRAIGWPQPAKGKAKG
jgi:transcriptional regulator with XRE-family HTH domain